MNFRRREGGFQHTTEQQLTASFLHASEKSDHDKKKKGAAYSCWWVNGQKGEASLSTNHPRTPHGNLARPMIKLKRFRFTLISLCLSSNISREKECVDDYSREGNRENREHCAVQQGTHSQRTSSACTKEQKNV